MGWTSLMSCSLLLCAVISLVSIVTSSSSEFIFTREPEDVIMTRGEPAMLHCSASYNSEIPKIQWVHDGVILNSGDQRRRILQNGTLKIESLLVSFESSDGKHPDEGIYQCLATVDNIGTIVSKKAALKLAYLGKTFRSEPRNASVHLGDLAMFGCDIEGEPKPNVRWFKDDLELNTDRANYMVHTDGVLEISSVQFSDFGSYKCLADNLDTERTSHVAKLTQTSDTSSYQGVPPRFIMEPSNTVTKDGSTVTLYCGANGRDRQGRPPTIVWLKDGVTIQLLDRFQNVGRGSLEINNVQLSDSGSYTCRATNSEDSIDVVAKLTVHVAPSFRKKPSTAYALVSEDIEFECDVTGFPQPSISWFKNRELIVPSAYFLIINEKNLRILGLLESDSGVYQCVAENSLGNIQATARLFVNNNSQALNKEMARGNVPSPHSLSTTPKPLHTGSNQVKPTPGVPTAPQGLKMVMVSERFVTLSWMMPNKTGGSDIIAYSVSWKEVNSDRERVMNTTRTEANIQELKHDTQYEFKVRAYNRQGPSVDDTIIVQTKKEVDVPGAPASIEAYAESSTEIKVTWATPLPVNGPILNYRIYWYTEGTTDESSKDAGPKEMQTIITDLKKYQTYVIRVAAFNENGAGMPSEEKDVTTLSDIPSEPPQNVTIETASSSSIIVRWEPPPKEAQNGMITGYKIRYKKKKKGVRGSDTAATDANRRSFALTGLEKGQVYMLRVLATNVNGSSPHTEWFEGETFTNDLDESQVPGQPTSLRVRPFDDEIAVSWTPPANMDVMVRGYVLGYGIGVPDEYKQYLDAKTRYYHIKDLKPSTEYVISLRATNNRGQGQQKFETVFTREETVPEPMTPMVPPIGVKAIVLSPNTIVVTWTDSHLGRNQRISDGRFYTIRYNPRGNRKVRYVNSTDLNIHIDDLRPNTEYEFSVKVIKGQRQSTWSMSASNKTFEDAPATAPRDLTPVAVEGQPTWITLNWQPPRSPNGQVTEDITGYLVFYTTDATLRDKDWIVEGVLGDKLSTTIRDLTPETTYYFKVQARNTKGYGPMSPTVIFRTPSLDGVGGGPIETPDDYGQQWNPNVKWSNGRLNTKDTGSKSDEGGIPKMTLWIILGCVGSVAMIVIVIIAIFICKRRSSGEEAKRKQGYQPANKGPKMMSGGPKGMKPPDLWIHDNMEMKGMGGKQTPDAMTPVPSETPDKMMEEDTSMMMDTRRNSFISDRHYDSQDEDRYQRAPGLIKPKLSMMMNPLDQPPPPRELATAIPNGQYSDYSGGDPSIPPRPFYSRTPGLPYNTPYSSNLPMYGNAPPYSSTPRVNAGEMSLSQPSSEPQYETSTLGRRSRFRLTPTSPVQPTRITEELQRRQTPDSSQRSLADYPVMPPRPGLISSIKPSQVNGQNTPSSPYKTALNAGPIQARSQLPLIAPDVTIREDGADSELPNSLSTEKLSAEMDDLAVLMRDLNDMQQQDFKR